MKTKIFVLTEKDSTNNIFLIKATNEENSLVKFITYKDNLSTNINNIYKPFINELTNTNLLNIISNTNFNILPLHLDFNILK